MRKKMIAASFISLATAALSVGAAEPLPHDAFTLDQVQVASSNSDHRETDLEFVRATGDTKLDQKGQAGRKAPAPAKSSQVDLKEVMVSSSKAPGDNKLDQKGREGRKATAPAKSIQKETKK